MSRVYTVCGDNVSLASAANTLVQINPGTTGPGFEIIRAYVEQRANATSAQQGIALGFQATAFSSGLTAATPQKTWPNDPAAAITGSAAGTVGTAGIGNATMTQGGGTFTTVMPRAFNVLNGFEWQPTKDEVYMFMPGGTLAFAFKFTVAPTTLTGWTFGVVYRELG